MKPFNEHGTKSVSMSVGDYALHGDVIITRVEAVPGDFAEFEQEKNSALAYGEATGHLHQLQGEPGVDFDLRVSKAGERHLRILKPTALKHQEHSPIVLPPGDYRIGVQREIDPFSKLIRQVAD